MLSLGASAPIGPGAGADSYRSCEGAMFCADAGATAWVGAISDCGRVRSGIAGTAVLLRSSSAGAATVLGAAVVLSALVCGSEGARRSPVLAPTTLVLLEVSGAGFNCGLGVLSVVPT